MYEVDDELYDYLHQINDAEINFYYDYSDREVVNMIIWINNQEKEYV